MLHKVLVIGYQNAFQNYKDLLISDVLPWLRELTGIDLYETVDATCAKYDYTDVLLCHDDELEGRRIAYIYYLVDPSWEKKDGGTLDLFNTDEFGQPHQIVHSIVPLWNSFVFFEVTPISFHQVSEVLTASKTRLTISGWFHGPSLPRPSPYKEVMPLMYHPLDKPLEVLAEWVSPVYLDVGTQSQIREQFESESQIELPDFLIEDKYKLLCNDLNKKVNIWERRGPPNKRNIEVAQPDKLLPLPTECHSLFLSEPFCLLLSHLTGLQLTSHTLNLNPNDDVSIMPESNNTPCNCHGDWYRWQHGGYTLMSDSTSTVNGENAEEFSLDAKLFFNTE
ncbi:PREDICTED: prolyl 3-hydroxylase OGFOD1-like, partial [Amphimedon queenslandica]|uniref:Prolyl 4-hydroxylase alpha subunit domain-containing protein n=1 Tax=Amphimedon queenslandica TaxID=400682 RepID=A0AAN0JR22_AMPQE